MIIRDSLSFLRFAAGLTINSSNSLRRRHFASTSPAGVSANPQAISKAPIQHPAAAKPGDTTDWAAEKQNLQLPKLTQTLHGVPVKFQPLYDAAMRRQLPPPLPDRERSNQEKHEVASWRPVVQLVRDHQLRVAVVGRMNSGKSSLWNSLVDEPLPHHQMTRDSEGITRDCVEAHGHLNGIDFTVIDTPGVVKGAVVLEARKLIESAHVVICVCAPDQPISSDEVLLAEYLRLRRLPCLLVVNKMDVVRAEDTDAVLKEFLKLGLGAPIPLSVSLRYGFDVLAAALAPCFRIHVMRSTQKDWQLEDRAANGDEEALEEVRLRNSAEMPIRIAFIGRSKSGKSSLMNRLLGFERSRTGSSGVVTRDSVEVDCTYRGKRLKLIDTAGMMRNRMREGHEFLEEINKATLRAIRYAHVCVLVFDATEGYPNRYDMALTHMCCDEGRPFVLCANKWDAVLDPSATAEAIDFKIKRQVHEVKYANAVVCSAASGLNLTLLMDHVMHIYDTWNRKVRSHELTRFWRMLEKSVVIPSNVTRVHRLVQVNTRPPAFLLKLQTRDSEETLPSHYVSLVKNALAEEFDFRGVPIRVMQEARDKFPDPL